MIPNAGLTMAEEMGLSSKADRVANVNAFGNPNSFRESDSPFSRLQLYADLSRPPQIKFNDLASAVNTPVIEDNPLSFDVRVDFFRQSDERVITAFTIQTDNQNLVFKDSGGIQQAQLNIFAKITHVSGRRAGTFEDPVITRATAEELRRVFPTSDFTPRTFVALGQIAQEQKNQVDESYFLRAASG